MNKLYKECEHIERTWVDKTVDLSFPEGIGIKTKCDKCGVIGYEIYDYSRFEPDE